MLTMIQDTDAYAEMVGIPWLVWVTLAVIAVGIYLLARASVDYSQLEDPDYLDDRTEYEARIDPFADHPMSCKCYHHR